MVKEPFPLEMMQRKIKSQKEKASIPTIIVIGSGVNNFLWDMFSKKLHHLPLQHFCPLAGAKISPDPDELVASAPDPTTARVNVVGVTLGGVGAAGAWWGETCSF